MAGDCLAPEDQGIAAIAVIGTASTGGFEAETTVEGVGGAVVGPDLEVIGVDTLVCEVVEGVGQELVTEPAATVVRMDGDAEQLGLVGDHLKKGIGHGSPRFFEQPAAGRGFGELVGQGLPGPGIVEGVLLELGESVEIIDS